MAGKQFIPDKRISLSDLPAQGGEVRTKLLWWQERGLSYTTTGYGARIPTSRQVRLPGEKRWRRVYVMIFSNSGSAYIDTKDGLIHVDD